MVFELQEIFYEKIYDRKVKLVICQHNLITSMVYRNTHSYQACETVDCSTITTLCLLHVQLLPATAVLGSGHSAGLTGGQLATTAAGGTSSGAAGAVLPVQSLAAGGTTYILAPNVYADQELAMIVNR